MVHRFRTTVEQAREVLGAIWTFTEAQSHDQDHFESHSADQEAASFSQVDAIEEFNAQSEAIADGMQASEMQTDGFPPLDSVVFSIDESTREVQSVWAFSGSRLGSLLYPRGSDAPASEQALARGSESALRSSGSFGEYLYRGDTPALTSRQDFEAAINADFANPDQIRDIVARADGVVDAGLARNPLLDHGLIDENEAPDADPDDTESQDETDPSEDLIDDDSQDESDEEDLPTNEPSSSGDWPEYDAPEPDYVPDPSEGTGGEITPEPGAEAMPGIEMTGPEIPEAGEAEGI